MDELLQSAPKIFNRRNYKVRGKGCVRLFGFGKKKKSKKELSVPPAPQSLDESHAMEGTISLDETLPPPSGFDEDIPPPRSVDEIEIPVARHEQPLQKLEFPAVPEEPAIIGGAPPDEPAKIEFFDDKLEVPAPAPPVEEAEPEILQNIEEHEMSLPSLEVEEREEAAPVKEEPQVVREKGGAIYVSLKQFDTIMQTIEEIKGSLRDCGESLTNANAIKNQEDTKLAKWHSTAENIQRKLLYVDKVLFE